MNISKERFLEKQGRQKRFLVTKILEGDTQTPIMLFQKLVGNEKGFLLESKEQGKEKGRYSIIGKSPFYETKGEDFKEVEEALKIYEVENEENLPFVGGAVGYAAYDIAKKFEKIPSVNEDILKMPDLHYMFVKEAVIYDHFKEKIILVKNIGEEEIYEEVEKEFQELIAIIEKPFIENKRNKEKNTKTAFSYTSNTTKEEFVERVRKAQQYIFDGDIFQVVLSQRFTMDITAEPFEIYRVLRGLNPSPYLFYINFGEYTLVGSSPEMMVEVRKGIVSTCPIAGTYPRGANEEEDERLAQALLQDEKEKAEHVMLVDLGRNDVGRISEYGSVKVPKLMEVEKYSHVMHLVSTVQGKMKPQYNMINALTSTVPAGTLSGAPKIRAMEIIEELEQQKRGVYGGAVGYLGFDGSMDTCIGIRTVICKEHKAYVQAGAGIVLDSVPEKEYEESLHKAKALLKTIEIAEGGNL